MDQTEPLDLDAIEARVNAATEGPWDLIPYGSGDPLGDAACREIVGPSDEPVIRQLGCGCCDVGLEGLPADAEFIQQLHRHLFKHARANAPQHVFAALALQDHRIDAGLVEQLPQEQPCGTGTDDGDPQWTMHSFGH